MISPCVFKQRKSDNYVTFIEITNCCKMKCKHCMNGSNDKEINKGFSIENIKKLLEELYENKTEKIYISGGEPLLYPYIDDVILYANSLGMKVTLATNGLEIPKHLDAIKKGVQLVSVSLDGIGKTHDKFRGVQGSYENCIEVLKLLKENNVKTKISAMIWKENIEELEDMIILAKSCGVSKINFAFMLPEGRAKLDETIKVPDNRYREIFDKMEKLIKKYAKEDFEIRFRRTDVLDKNSLDCPGGKNLMHIDVNGKVSPCSWIAKLDKENEFSSYWPKSSISECIKKFDAFDNCKKTRKDKFGYCGCIALANMYNGNFLAEDPLNKVLKESRR